MKKSNILLLLTCLVVLATVVGSIYAYKLSAWSYSGKVVFNTEEEYTKFKQDISDENIKIVDVKSLSSAPPIVVDFEVETQHDYLFNYGNLRKDANGNRGVIIAGGVAISFVLIFAIIIKYSN
jgi:hypothetical protein